MTRTEVYRAPQEESASAYAWSVSAVQRSHESRSRAPERSDVAGRHEQAGLAVDDEVAQAADRRRDHRPAVRHRLGARDAVALAVRGARHDGGPLVQAEQPVVRDEAERLGNPVAQRTVAGHDQRHPVGRLYQVEHAFLRREPPGVEDVRRLVRLAHGLGHVDTAWDHAHCPGAELARGPRELLRRADREPGPPEDEAGEPGCLPGELHIGAPQLDHERTAGRGGHEPARQPVGMDEVGVA
jgi:hypothetical protein